MVAASLERLPPELIICLISYLEFVDFVSLSSTTKLLQSLLKDEGLCEKVAKQHINYTPETQLADRGNITYQVAVARAFSRKQALALGKPYSMVTVGYGTSFVYSHGFLCYKSGQYVRILNIIGAASQEKVIDLGILGHFVHDSEAAATIEVVHYRDDLLFLRFQPESKQLHFDPFLVAVETANSGHLGRLIWRSIAGEPRNTVVKNDHNHLLVASYTGRFYLPDQTGSYRHEWQIRYMERTAGPNYLFEHSPWSRTIQLRDFFGLDLGQTIAFEIFDGYFYAVSNQSTFEVEEVDWTSYYHCWRIKLQPAENRPQLQHQRVWRRQHREGVIADNWTDLTLHQDEKTGVVAIVEARREYIGNSSRSNRTFYFHAPVFDEADDIDYELPEAAYLPIIATPGPSGVTAGNANDSTGSFSHPENDVLAKTLTKDDNPNYEKPPIRIPSAYHTEPPPPPNNRTPIASHYKYRTYIPSAATSLDLIQRHGSPNTSFRISSRYLSSPLDPATGLLRPPMYDSSRGEAIEGSEVAFVDRTTVVWPPEDASPLLREVLNPGGAETRSGETKAMADERSIVFTSGGTFRPYGQAITLVNFDRHITFNNHHSNLPAPKDGEAEDDAHEVEKLRQRMRSWRESVGPSKSDFGAGIRADEHFVAVNGVSSRWMWTEDSWARSGCGGGEYVL